MSDTRSNVEAAVTAAFRENDEMVSRWINVAEVIDAEGVRSVWIVTAEGQAPWDSIGLLGFAQQFEQARAVRECFDAD